MVWINSFKHLPHRQTFNLAWPMILSNISTPAMTLADSAILGHRETPVFLGAVAIGGNILALLFWMFSFLRMSTTSLIGQALGANNELVQLKHFSQSALIALVVGALMLLLQWIIVPIAISLMAPDPELKKLSAEYCHIRIFAAPAVFLNYVLMGWFIGHKNTRIPLFVTVSANLLNIALDYWLIVILDMGSRGAAFASLAAETSACLIAITFAAPQLLVLKRKSPPMNLLTSTAWHRLFKINSHLMVRTVLLLLVFNFFTAQSANLGVTALATNALLMQLAIAVSFALDGYAHAAESLVAHAVGAKNTQNFTRACAAATFASLVIAVALSCLFVVAGIPIIGLLTDQEQIRANASQYLIWVQILPVVSVWCYLLDGIFIGASKTRLLRNYMLVGTLAVFLPAWYLLRPFENHGLWAAFTFLNLFRGASLGWAFYNLTLKRHWFQ